MNCKTHAIITDVHNGEIFCSKCGLVIEENIAVTEKYTSSENHEKQSHHGAMSSNKRHDKGLGTSFDLNKDHSGKKISKPMQQSLHRLKQFHYDEDSNKRNDIYFHKILINIAGRLNLSNTEIEEAIRLAIKYRALLRGRTIANFVAALCYLISRQYEHPKTIVDIVKILDVNKKSLKRAIREFLKVHDFGKPTDCTYYIYTIAAKLNLSESFKRRAVLIYNDKEIKKISASKNPVTFASAIIHLLIKAKEMPVTLKKIARTSGMSEVGISGITVLCSKNFDRCFNEIDK